LRERLVSAIHSLRDPEPALLLAIFGLTVETATLPLLRQRRAHYGRTIGRSVETVADLEPAALEHLRLQLVTGWYPLSPLTGRIPVSHNGVIFESIGIRVVIKNRHWHETRENYRFFAAFDEAEYLTISSSYPGRAIPIGDDFTVRTLRVGESISHHFWHRTPMRRGQFYDLRYRLVQNESATDRTVITETSRAFHEPTRLARIETVFLGPLPTVIWQFERLSYFERPGVPNSSRMLPLRDGRTAVEYHDLCGGLFNGIAWAWE
jgi:hypothetical protein